MDEILNRWSTSLDSSIKEFSRQAAEVSAWDRVLLKGGDEISSLLTALSAAEEKQAGIDRTLDYLESSQSDLTALVGDYEAQIESLLPAVTGGAAGAGGMNLTSADVERERAYGLAETLNGQLDDVSKNLAAMIGELNSSGANGGARSGGNEGKDGADAWAAEGRDGSIAQIVAILNAHLGSLKWIDQSAGALRGKLEGLRRGQV